jgi:hypothetical protein
VVTGFCAQIVDHTVAAVKKVLVVFVKRLQALVGIFSGDARQVVQIADFLLVILGEGEEDDGFSPLV